MNTIRKYLLLVGTTVLIGCQSPQKDQDGTVSTRIVESPEESNEDINEKVTTEREDDKNAFDNSLIPGEVAYFIQTEFDSLRFPFEADYDYYFYNGHGGDEWEPELPYFCSGYFNNDTILDYAVVLIKDTTSHYVIALHQEESSFDYYILSKKDLVPGDTTEGKYVTFLINTETDKEAEHILGTYIIDNESIGITDMYESRGFWATWSNEKNQYIDLLFD